MRVDRTATAISIFFLSLVSMAGETGPAIDELDEVLIVGRQPGPALWQVKSGEHSLWILAQVRTLPTRMR